MTADSPPRLARMAMLNMQNRLRLSTALRQPPPISQVRNAPAGASGLTGASIRGSAAGVEGVVTSGRTAGSSSLAAGSRRGS